MPHLQNEELRFGRGFPLFLKILYVFVVLKDPSHECAGEGSN